MHKEYVVTQDQMGMVAADILQLSGVRIITLIGSLGAGKTTLVQALLRQLGITEPVASPTYTYVNLYKTVAGNIIYHFDLYRLTKQDDFIQAGFDEYLYQENAWCLIEWPEVIEGLLPDEGCCRIQIEYIDDKTRKISMWS